MITIRRLLTFVFALSVLTCLAIIAMWIRNGSAPRGMELHFGHDKSITIYAGREGIGWRKVGAKGAQGWEFPYATAILLTLTIPVLLAWRSLAGTRARKLHSVEDSIPKEERLLRQQIRFLLPDAVAAACMIGFAVEAIDAPTGFVWLFIAPIELALVANIVVRHRLNRRLTRMNTNRCPHCGYSLTGNTSGICPECGTPVQPKEVTLFD